MENVYATIQFVYALLQLLGFVVGAVWLIWDEVRYAFSRRHEPELIRKTEQF